MIENVLILDTETNGLSPEKHQIIEIALVLYNVKHKTIFQQFSTLFPCDENLAEDINGIKAEATQVNFGNSYWRNILWQMFNSSHLIVAHNASFDRSFINKIIYLHEPNWICTKNDFEWPVPLPRKRLQDICETMGVKYEKAHRALSDCLFIVDCFNKVDDLESRLQKAYEKVTR